MCFPYTGRLIFCVPCARRIPTKAPTVLAKEKTHMERTLTTPGEHNHIASVQSGGHREEVTVMQSTEVTVMQSTENTVMQSTEVTVMQST